MAAQQFIITMLVVFANLRKIARFRHPPRLVADLRTTAANIDRHHGHRVHYSNDPPDNPPRLQRGNRRLNGAMTARDYD